MHSKAAPSRKDSQTDSRERIIDRPVTTVRYIVAFRTAQLRLWVTAFAPDCSLSGTQKHSHTATCPCFQCTLMLTCQDGHGQCALQLIEAGVVVDQADEYGLHCPVLDPPSVFDFSYTVPSSLSSPYLCFHVMPAVLL